MELIVKRIQEGKNSTLSEIYLEGRFVCHGLEDRLSGAKVYNDAAIPAGGYALGLKRFGAMHARFTRRFPKMHQGMLHILGIPDRKYAYIHVGKDFGDTHTGIVVGVAYQDDELGDFLMLKSAKAYKRLYRLLVDAVIRGSARLVMSDQ